MIWKLFKFLKNINVILVFDLFNTNDRRLRAVLKTWTWVYERVFRHLMKVDIILCLSVWYSVQSHSSVSSLKHTIFPFSPSFTMLMVIYSLQYLVFNPTVGFHYIRQHFQILYRILGFFNCNLANRFKLILTFSLFLSVYV